MNIEEKVSETILETEKSVVINGRKYVIAPPTTATLIMASGLISKLPKFELGENDIVTKSLSIAKDCDVIADILAVFVLGAKKAKKRFRLPFFNRYERLKNDILNDSPHKIDEIIGVCLKSLEITDFFLVITFLNSVNLTRATK